MKQMFRYIFIVIVLFCSSKFLSAQDDYLYGTKWGFSLGIGVMPGSENPNFEHKVGMNILMRVLRKLDHQQAIGFGIGQQANYLDTEYSYYPFFLSYQKNWFSSPTFQTKINVGYSVAPRVESLELINIVGHSSGGLFFNPSIGMRVINSPHMGMYLNVGIMHQKLSYEFEDDFTGYYKEEDWTVWRYIFGLTIEI